MLHSSRLLPWLFACLLLIGQQAGLLHHLGHDFDEVARVTAAALDSAKAGSQLPDTEEHAHACVLCVAYASAESGAAAGAPLAVLVDLFSFFRPLASAAPLRPAALAGTPIRGPPQDFSVRV